VAGCVQKVPRFEKKEALFEKNERRFFQKVPPFMKKAVPSFQDPAVTMKTAATFRSEGGGCFYAFLRLLSNPPAFSAAAAGACPYAA
jgi:hypothetical protein